MTAPALLSVIRRCGDLEPAQFPRGQPRALEQRPRLVDPDAGQPPGGPGRFDHADRGAVAGRGQGAGIAVGQDPVALLEQLATERADPPVRLDVLPVQVAGPAKQSLPQRLALAGFDGAVTEGAALVQGPAQVDRRRPGREQELPSGVEVAGAEDQAVGRGNADRRRAPHGEPANRAGDVLRPPAAKPDLLLRQPGLVQQQKPVAAPPDRREALLRRARLLHPHARSVARLVRRPSTAPGRGRSAGPGSSPCGCRPAPRTGGGRR